MKIWDVRALNGPICDYILRTPANQLAISQRGLIAFGMENQCEIYRKPNLVSVKTPYLRHRFDGIIGNMQFCPFEDVLGVATSKGFSSLIVPGSGEPNFDALEANPYQTKSQRKESEVHALLDKIPPELIKLDPTLIAQVDVPTLSQNIETKKSLLVSVQHEIRSFTFILDHLKKKILLKILLFRFAVSQTTKCRFQTAQENERQGRLGECVQSEENRSRPNEETVSTEHQRCQTANH